jgi:hypothetical protein
MFHLYCIIYIFVGVVCYVRENLAVTSGVNGPNACCNNKTEPIPRTMTHPPSYSQVNPVIPFCFKGKGEGSRAPRRLTRTGDNLTNHLLPHFPSFPCVPKESASPYTHNTKHHLHYYYSQSTPASSVSPSHTR